MFLYFYYIFLFFSEISRAETEAVEPDSSLGKEAVNGIACARTKSYAYP